MKSRARQGPALFLIRTSGRLLQLLVRSALMEYYFLIINLIADVPFS